MTLDQFCIIVGMVSKIKQLISDDLGRGPFQFIDKAHNCPEPLAQIYFKSLKSTFSIVVQVLCFGVSKVHK